MRVNLSNVDLRDLVDTSCIRPFIYETEKSISLHFNLGATQSQMLTADPFGLALDYTRVMMACLFFVPVPKTILMIGLGGGSLAKYCHRNIPEAHTTVVEINPDVIALRETFLIPPDCDRFQVICADGANFIRECQRQFDVVMVDGYLHDGVPDELCTQDFYDACRSALTTQGVMVANLDGSAENYQALLSRISLSFDDSAIAIPAGGRCNQAVFACSPFAMLDTRAQLLSRWNQMSPVHQSTLSPSKVIKHRAPGRYGCVLQEQLERATYIEDATE